MEMMVTQHEEIANEVFELTVCGEFPWHEIQAGQFVQVQVDRGYTHVLRRPISIAFVDTKERLLKLVYRVVGGGTAQLSQVVAGETIDLFGPLGHGYPLPKGGSKVLVIGGGLGIPPLYELSRRLLAASVSVQVILGWSHASQVFWVDRFEQLDVPLLIMTNDGSVGSAGTVVDAMATLPSAEFDQIMACGPKPMLAALQTWCRPKSISGYVSLEERMACGIGACTGCVCDTIHGLRRVCADGPVFALSEVIL